MSEDLIEQIREKGRDLNNSEAELEDLLRALSSAFDGVSRYDIDGVCTYANPAFSEQFGYELSEVLGTPWEKLILEEDHAAMRAAIRECQVTGRALFEVRGRTGDGDLYWKRISLVRIPPLNRSARYNGFYAFVRDNHVAKLAYIELAHSEERFRSLTHLISDLVWVIDPNLPVQPDHVGWRVFTGQSVEQVQNGEWLTAVHPEDQSRVGMAWLEANINKTAYKVEHRILRSDGVYRWMLAYGVPLLNPDGSIREWVGLHQDITDQKAAAALLQDHSA